MNRLASRRVVLLLYNAKSDSFTAQELVERQLKYIYALKKLAKSDFIPPIILASGFQEVNLPSSEVCKFISLSKRNINPLIFLLRSFFLLRRSKAKNSSYFFVAGNPLQPLAISLLLKLLFRGSALQVSIHNDLKSWFMPGLLNALKRNLLRICIPQIDLFRFVSKAQKEVAEELFPLKNKQKVICPIPVDLPSSKKNVQKDHEEILGFVGRVHEERGVSEWIEISKNLPDFRPFIVGDGPLLQNFKYELKGANLVGKYSHLQTLQTYRFFSVLLSCAPYESYGLTIREALLAGVPVVTRNTVGVRELLDLFPGIIKSYESVAEAVSLIRDISVNADQKQFQLFATWFLIEQDSNLNELASFWH